MEIEASLNNGIFYHINEAHLADIRYGNMIYQLEVSFQRFQPHSHKLFLTKNYLYLAELSKNAGNV